MTHQLAHLGWDDHWSSVLCQYLESPAAPPEPVLVGRVGRTDQRRCDVLLADGSVSATWGGADAPVTGDWVLVQDRGGYAVVGVLPRRTAITRAPVDGSSTVQVLAANADLAVVVESLHPGPKVGRVERLLALAWASGAQPVLLLTKADLAEPPAALLATPGVAVLVVSAVTGEGLAPLREWLAGGRTLALLGASGVGKSTLLNALVGSEQARTQGVRSDGKGRHTTVTRELHLVGGGAVLDTPGMRAIGLAEDAAVGEVFTDIENLAQACRFRDCAHRSEPGCAVLAAVAAGDLPERRLASYRRLLREAQHQAARTDARLRAELTDVWKARTREYRRRPNRKL